MDTFYRGNGQVALASRTGGSKISGEVALTNRNGGSFYSGLSTLIIIAIFSGATKFKKNADNSIEAEASTPGLPGLIDKIMDCYERYQQQQRLNNAEMLRIMNSMQIKNPGDNDDRDS